MFSSGVEVMDVTIRNDAGIFEPMNDAEKFIASSLVANDGKPLKETKSATIALVSTSFNSGFKPGGDGEKPVAGELPVLVARVAGVVKSDSLTGMRYKFRDWNYSVIEEGVVVAGTLVIPSTKPVFITELSR